MTLHKIIMGCFFCIALGCSHKKGPKIEYATKVINLGAIEIEKEFVSKIKLKNIGDETLKILNATPDCSCTVIDENRLEIAPGDSSFLYFKLTPAIDGYLQQNIYLDNNSINESRVLFLIRAKVHFEK